MYKRHQDLHQDLQEDPPEQVSLEDLYTAGQIQDLATVWAKGAFARGFDQAKILEILDPDFVVGVYLWLVAQAEDGPQN
jgi:hypothetical protein